MAPFLRVSRSDATSPFADFSNRVAPPCRGRRDDRRLILQSNQWASGSAHRNHSARKPVCSTVAGPPRERSIIALESYKQRANFSDEV